MSVQAINDHVLIPHPPNWARNPDWERSWQSEVAYSIDGSESRATLRAHPRVRLRWTTTTLNLQELAAINDRLLAALKSGKACAPYWGMGSILAANVTASTVDVEPGPWVWAEDDYLFLLDNDMQFDVRQISGVAGDTLTLSSPVSRTYLAGDLVWPLLFGTLEANALLPITHHHGEVQLALRELVSADTVTIGGLGPGGIGIGFWIIEDDFVVT